MNKYSVSELMKIHKALLFWNRRFTAHNTTAFLSFIKSEAQVKKYLNCFERATEGVKFKGVKK